MPDLESIGVVILAAGESRRLGRPKQTVLFNGETLLDRAIRSAREGGYSDVLVVLGSAADTIKAACVLQDCRTVINADWQSGVASSICVGVSALQGRAGAVIMTCDMPHVGGEHLRALATSVELTASRYAERNGIPAYFPAHFFDELKTLRGDVGARHLLGTAASIHLSGGDFDIDTENDLRRITNNSPSLDREG